VKSALRTPRRCITVCIVSIDHQGNRPYILRNMVKAAATPSALVDLAREKLQRLGLRGSTDGFVLPHAGFRCKFAVSCKFDRPWAYAAKHQTDRTNMTDGRLPEADKDFSAIVEKELCSISELPLPQALERLTALEKQTRQASDAISTKTLLVKVVQLCAQSKDWDTLNEQILAFSKKHGQLKAAAQGMVAECWHLLKSTDWIEEHRIEQRDKLIETLRVVTEGKVQCIQERGSF
jgi:hypothetical protein